jgi:hypothetical protein
MRFFCLLGVFFVFSLSPAAADAISECRTAALPDGTPAMFCKDKSGKWKQQAGEVIIAPSAASTSGLPVKAEATYQGTYYLDYEIPQRKRRVRGLNDLLGAAVDGAFSSRKERSEGAITTKMMFDGPSVTGVFSGSTLITTKMIGLIKDGVCTMNNVTSGSSAFVKYAGPCGPQGFSGTIVGQTARGEKYTGKFTSTTIQYVDTSERDSRRAELQRQCDGGKQSACVELDQK